MQRTGHFLPIYICYFPLTTHNRASEVSYGNRAWKCMYTNTKGKKEKKKKKSQHPRIVTTMPR